MKDKILNFDNWIKCEFGYYKLMIRPGILFEILVNFGYKDTPILTHKASLYLVYSNRKGIERRCVEKELPVQYLLEVAQKHYCIATNTPL